MKKKKTVSDLEFAQAQCDIKKWLESERAEKDLSGKMDFCEGCDYQSVCIEYAQGTEVEKKVLHEDIKEHCECAKNAKRLEKRAKK